MKHGRPDYQANVQAPPEFIPADEPVFLLRAQDCVAPATVRLWAKLARDAGASDEIYNAAIGVAESMEDWQDQHGPKVPDMP